MLDFSAHCILSRYINYLIFYNWFFLKTQSLTGMSKNIFSSLIISCSLQQGAAASMSKRIKNRSPFFNWSNT